MLTEVDPAMGSNWNTYEAAVACVRGQGRVQQFELARRLGADWRDMVSHLDRMQREGIIKRRDARGWHEVVARQPVTAAESDAWRRRALDAERQLQQQQPQSSPPAPGLGARLQAVRRHIAKELHPDYSGSPAEAAVRSELFKRIWPKLEELAYA